MKKKLILIPLLVLILLASMGTTVLAWDEEDSLVASNEDFIAGGGFDDGVMETQSGAQPWPYGKNPNEGYSLYRDDVTDTGNLDSAFILTYTSDEVDLPIIAEYWYPDTGTYYYMGDVSPDTYYWATEPRGIDYTKVDILSDSNIPGGGLDTAPGLNKEFNPKSKAEINAGKK